jgi:hypothetical protein
MKIALVLFACMMTSIGHAAQVADSVEFETTLSTATLNFFESSVSAFSAGTYQGEATYGAQIECSNPDGDSNAPSDTMTCYARSIAGFSRDEAKVKETIKVPASLASQWIAQLKKGDYSYLVTHGISVLGGTLQCQRDVGTGFDRPDSCSLSKLKL